MGGILKTKELELALVCLSCLWVIIIEIYRMDLTMNPVIEQMQAHVSVRKYTDEQIPLEKLEQMLSAAQCAASSHFVQAYSVIAVNEPERKKVLAKLTGNPHVETCATFLVFCADLKRLQKACEMHEQKIQAQTTENLLVATVDVALLAQNFALAAEANGYGICFIGGIRNQPRAVCDFLHIPEHAYAVFGMTVGVPEVRNATKPRLPVASILHHEHYSDKAYLDELLSYDAHMQEYYRTRASNQKAADWSKSMSEFMSKQNRVHMREFLAEQGLNLE